MISLLRCSSLISSWSSSSLILTPWCFWHMICGMFVGIQWIIKLCSDCDWYLLWSIWDWSWVVVRLYNVDLLFKIFLAHSCCLSVALYHLGHVVGCNSKREFSRKMVGFVSLDDQLEWQKHGSGECVIATKENIVMLVTVCCKCYLIYALCLIQLFVALSS